MAFDSDRDDDQSGLVTAFAVVCLIGPLLAMLTLGVIGIVQEVRGDGTDFPPHSLPACLHGVRITAATRLGPDGAGGVTPAPNVVRTLQGRALDSYDLGGDGVDDLYVGGGQDAILFLRANGTVRRTTRVANTSHADIWGDDGSFLVPRDNSTIEIMVIRETDPNFPGSDPRIGSIAPVTLSQETGEVLSVGTSTLPHFGIDVATFEPNQNWGSPRMKRMHDVTGDGVDDLIVGNMWIDTDTANDVGNAFLVELGPGGEIGDEALLPLLDEAPDGFARWGDLFGASFGTHCAFDKEDNIPDLVVGAEGSAESIAIILMGDWASTRRWVRIDRNHVYETVGLDPTADNPGDFGIAVECVDLNGDGVDEVLVGESRGFELRGELWAIGLHDEAIAAGADGKDAILWVTRVTSPPVPVPLFEQHLSAANIRIGRALAIVNGVTSLDGVPVGDGTVVAVGAYREPAGGSERGSVWLVLLQPGDGDIPCVASDSGSQSASGPTR